MSRPIRKAAVIGAGVMGSGIAAHLANAGIPCYLLDIVPKELTPDEAKKGLTLDSPEVRNRFANNGLQNAIKAKPAALFSKKDAALITTGNIEDNLNWVSEVDWVVEVVLEKVSVKQQVFGNIEKHWKPGTIVSSNTSGISIKEMMEGRSKEFKKHFLVTHFFNPVRYMKLLELIAGEETDPAIVAAMAKFGENELGKGIVYGKDTPNFVANRIGVYGIMNIIQHMQKLGYTIEEADAIFGAPMGRPKSAVFRTADMVGIDTFVHVSDNVYEHLTKDPFRETFKAPEFLRKIVANGWLGDKSGQGFYKKIKGEGKKETLGLDLNTLEYRPSAKVRFDSTGVAKGIDDVGEKIKTIVFAEDRAGQIAWPATRDTLLYTAGLVFEIADDIVNIDNAMKWGFNWNLGPFEVWDVLGVRTVVDKAKADGVKIPVRIQEFLDGGNETFYKNENGTLSFYDFKTKKYTAVEEKSNVILLPSLKDRKRIIKENMGTSLVDLDDGVACLEFHTKMNAVDDDIIMGMIDGLDYVEANDWKGLVIGNQAENFCVGANIMLILMNARQSNWEDITKAVRAFQDVNMRLRYSPKPVVAAPFGMTLGGGCEISMAADRMCAHAETYMGLVEVGVGLIPAGSGTKEVLLRNLESIPDNAVVEPFPYIRRAFETIGMAKVSFSVKEAQELGYMKKTDKIAMNRDQQIWAAKQSVLALALDGYKQPHPRTGIRLPGEDAFATLQLGLYTMKEGGYISEHDALIGSKVAYILTGGKTTLNQTVTEQYILDLECEAFLSLCGEEKSQARIEYMLMNGKPLRN